MVILARKNESPGAVAEEFQHSIESELAGLKSSGRIAELERQAVELERQAVELEQQLERFRRQPVIRLALAARRAIRRAAKPRERTI
jgi:molecular chaperone GrpE (heat shock protein)